MKLYDGAKIITGLLIFVGLMAAPIIYGIAKPGEKPKPSLDTPVINALEEKKCVEPKEFMRAEHMQLLDEWRDMALRDGEHTYVNSEGKEFEISLQNTCMNCHSNKEKFCDTCHNYLAVKPYCWDCHIVPTPERL